MKKILFATTALVATAGVASAEIKLTGMAEMGIANVDSYDITTFTTNDGETQFFTDIDVTFTMSGEADNGLTFGATIDLDEEGGFSAFNGGPEAVFVSFGGATLTMGDTDGAFDARVAEMALAGGSLNDDETTHAGFNHADGGLNGSINIIAGGIASNSLDGLYDGQVARFDYTFDAFTGSLSVEIDDAGVGEPIWGLGVSYNAELAGLDLGVGLGYQTLDGFGDVLGLSLTTQFANGLEAGLTYSETNYDGISDNQTHWGIGLGYTMNALAIGVNYGEYNDILGVSGLDQSGFGLAATYDLGGGLSARLGYGSSSYDGVPAVFGVDDHDSFSMGLRMNF